MKRTIVIAMLVAGCGSAVSESDPADRELCKRLRDRVVDLRFADATGIDTAPHRDAMSRSLGEPFITTCTTTMTVGEARCAIAAPNVDAAAACSNQKN